MRTSNFISMPHPMDMAYLKYYNLNLGSGCNQRFAFLVIGILFKILDEQFGVCAICGNPETRKRNGRIWWFSVDHCHKTNINRGLLCTKCNTGLGNFDDDIDIMASAISYLQHADKRKALRLIDLRTSTSPVNDGIPSEHQP